MGSLQENTRNQTTGHREGLPNKVIFKIHHSKEHSVVGQVNVVKHTP